jgi:hypothetical protein
MTNFTEKQKKELVELLINKEYDKFVEEVEQITGSFDLAIYYLDSYFEELGRI